MLKPLPTSTSTFRDIIKGGYLYVDKTEYIYALARHDKGAYFLARPRRFGKSLLISTLDELFRGNRELFRGLWIDSTDYDWAIHPVIRIDFNRYQIRSAAQLEQRIPRYLQRVAQEYNLVLADDAVDLMFEELILQLSSEKYGGKQVVILIDEYDKPLIDNLENLAEAKKIRDTLKGFYGVIKAMDRYIRLSFITGISKFSKVGVFSDLNNLTDLTLNRAFATILGLTEAEIRHDLAAYIPLFAQKEGLTDEAFIEKMRHWYDGFCFAAEAENVYNPFSTINLFYNQHFANYWFESGTPTFLIRFLHRQNYDVEQLKALQVEELAFSNYDIDRLSIIPLLFQTGYLTIKGYVVEQQIYKLDYPNYEVENAFLTYLLDAFSYLEQGLSTSHLRHLVEALQQHDLERFFSVLKVFYANIDYDLYLDHEKYYQTIFYLLFSLIGLRTEAEVKSNSGRIDAVVELDGRIYLFEFKLNKNSKVALKQIHDHYYYQKYQLHGKPITCVGVTFNTRSRTIDDWEIAEVSPL